MKVAGKGDIPRADTGGKLNKTCCNTLEGKRGQKLHCPAANFDALYLFVLARTSRAISTRIESTRRGGVYLCAANASQCARLTIIIEVL